MFFYYISHNINLLDIVMELNMIDLTIEFSYEFEKNKCLPFPDILLIRNNKLGFNVYRKPTNKNDIINVYSHQKIQSELVIGF